MDIGEVGRTVVIDVLVVCRLGARVRQPEKVSILLAFVAPPLSTDMVVRALRRDVTSALKIPKAFAEKTVRAAV